jgi:hypothetical protein
MAMLERNATFAELYENWAAHARRVFLAHSEFSKVITGTLEALTESQELIAEADTALGRSGVMIIAQKSPAARFTMRNTPRRTQREIDELNRRFATCMTRLRPDERELLADWIAGWMAVYTNFGGQ